jgi:hypothetical protein
MATPKVIVNADDLGKDARTNERIMDCFDRGLISSASVMVTTRGFDEVVRWYHARNSKPTLGIHIDLDEGFPVADSFLRLFGEARLLWKPDLLWSDGRYLSAARAEIRAQIERFLDAGIPLDHVDSHHHVHTYFPLARIVAPLAVEFRARRLRVSGNILYPGSVHKRAYRFFVNTYLLTVHRATTVKYFSHLDRFCAQRPFIPGDAIELMVHPGVDQDYDFLLSPTYTDFLNQYALMK